MPRIDPLKLLTCLSVLLAENGGIRSTQEVKRLAGLMAKFSKKLVSKCIYIHILKCTKTELLGQFMAAGGWTLTHQWLADGMNKLNWPLVQEILELLLLCPVDVPRLKSNSSPKLVKSLSKDNSNEGVRILATKLVEQWLKIVKFETSSVEMMPESSKLENSPMNSDNQSMSGNSMISSPTLTVGQTTITKVPTKKVDESRSNNNINFLDCNIAEDNDNNYAIDESLFRSPESESQCINNRNDLAITLNEKSSCKMLNNINKPTETLVFKITVKDGKQVLAKVESSSPKKTSTTSAGKKLEENDKDINKDIEKVKSTSGNDKDRDSTKSKSKDREREKDKQKEKDRDRKPISSSSHRSSSSSSKSSSKTHSHKSSSSSSSSSKSSSKDRHRSSSSKSSSSSSSNKDKNKDKQSQAEKDKDTLAKVMAPTLDKIGKIPKKSKDESSTSNSSTSSKKPSISIEVRKDAENRPKTVKTFNSQFRSHGLAEEAPPPPSRKGLKKPTSGIATSPIPIIAPTPISSLPKRSSSPSKDVPPEKKVKTETNSEKPGSIKLIPAKPKPTLVESDMFMDALSASVTTSKKDLKKRKRRTSTSKDASVNGSPPGSPGTPTSPTKVISAPLKFYQDTLDDNNVSDDQKSKVKNDDAKEDVSNLSNDSRDADDSSSKAKKLKRENSDDASDENCDTTGSTGDDNIKNENSPKDEETAVNEKKVPGPGCGVDGPPGVLMLHRRKGPKKQLKWRPVEQLEEIRYFELDENERVNVTKTFTDMKQMERYNEREAFLMARKLSSEDTMVEQTPWTALIEFDSLPIVPDGNQSKEKEIQAERERTVLKALYFNKQMIPDSPSEPDIELFQNLEPQVIPLDDIAGNSNSVNDFTTMPWPDPKSSPNQSPTNLGHCISVESPYSGVDVYPNKLQWFQSEIPQFPDGQFPISIPGTDIPPVGVPPFGLAQLNFGGGGNFNNFQQNPPPSNRHRQGNQGGGWYRPNGPPPSWNNNNNRQSGNMQSGGGSQRPWMYGNNRGICKQFQNKGFCRQGDKCNYLHITGNGSNF